jgi:hypothetical protein
LNHVQNSLICIHISCAHNLFLPMAMHRPAGCRA